MFLAYLLSIATTALASSCSAVSVAASAALKRYSDVRLVARRQFSYNDRYAKSVFETLSTSEGTLILTSAHLVECMRQDSRADLELNRLCENLNVALVMLPLRSNRVAVTGLQTIEALYRGTGSVITEPIDVDWSKRKKEDALREFSDLQSSLRSLLTFIKDTQSDDEFMKQQGPMKVAGKFVLPNEDAGKGSFTGKGRKGYFPGKGGKGSFTGKGGKGFFRGRGRGIEHP